MEDVEIWKDIENYEGIYQVSNWGRIKSMKRVFYKRKARRNHETMPVYMPEKIRSIRLNPNGYVTIALWNNGKYKHCLVHRLVAIYFVKNPFPEIYNQVLHLDNNPANARWDNLIWGTQKQNIQQSVKQGRWHTGQKNFQTKLKDEDIPKIRELIAEGLSSRKIAEKFNVNKHAILSISNNKTWKHII